MPAETSPNIRLPLTGWVLIISAAITVAAAFGVAQFQIVNHENRITTLEVREGEVRELLIRIDERTAEIKRRLDNPGVK